MGLIAQRTLWAAAAFLVFYGCSDGAAWLDQRGELPPTLSEVGLFPDAADLERHHGNAVPYAPQFALWSNGLRKRRHIALLEGARVQLVDGELGFPEGTVFFKTFSDDDGPVETRVMIDEGGAWRFEVFVWNRERSDASLADISSSTPVSVRVDSESLEHEVPSRRQCRLCHESNASGPVLGFETLMLQHRLPGDGAELDEQLVAAGVLAEPIGEDASRIDAEDETTLAVLGYLEANCVHCHNGVPGPNTSFDLGWEGALEALIDQPTRASGGTAGIRVVPGEPEQSIVWLAIAGNIDDAMPPLGVQRRDAQAVALFGEWIEELDTEEEPED